MDVREAAALLPAGDEGDRRAGELRYGCNFAVPRLGPGKPADWVILEDGRLLLEAVKLVLEAVKLVLEAVKLALDSPGLNFEPPRILLDGLASLSVESVVV